MITIPQLKVFLEDRTAGFEKIGTKIYTKVPYNQNLVLLYCLDEFSMKENSMDYMGIYSLSTGDFLATSSAYFSVSISDDFKEKEIAKIEEELNEKVQNELLAILESLVVPSPAFSDEVINKAKECKLANKNPEFTFNEYEGSELTIENIEDFYTDKDDYAYNIAENIINNDTKCIQRYQKYVDIKKAIEEMDNNMPIDLEIEAAIKPIRNETSYKNLKIQVLTKNGVEDRQIETRFLDDYPLYAIQKVYWGRKLLFDLNDYDATKVDALRTNREYNIKAINGVSGYHNSLETMWSCIDERMFDDYGFCKEICKKYSHQYDRISERYRRNINFIKDSKVSSSIIFESTPDETIQNNKVYFLDLFKNNPCYSSLSAQMREDIDFVCAYVRTNGKDAIHELNEKFFQNDKVQKAFDDWYLNNPANLNSSWYEPEKVKVSLLKNRDTKIFALNVSYLKSLSKDDLNDKSLIMDFLKRIEFTNKNKHTVESADNFTTIYSTLDVLKTDADILDKMLDICNVDGSCWRVLDASMKTKDIQRRFVEKNENMLSSMDDDIKLEFVYADPKKYLLKMYEPEVKHYNYGRRTFSSTPTPKVDEALLLDLIKVSKDISFISDLNHNQISDKKLILKMMAIKPEAYKYLDGYTKDEYDIAKEAVKYFSVIQYLPNKSKHHNSLYNNEEIMKASLKWCPEDFYYIPQASRQTGPAPLLNKKDFILFAVRLDANNANYIDPKTGFLEDEDVCFEAVTGDIDTVGAFAGKLYRNEPFVYRLCAGIMDQINQLQSDELKEVWYKETREVLINVIPKKIKDTADFKAQFPKFVE